MDDAPDSDPSTVYCTSYAYLSTVPVPRGHRHCYVLTELSRIFICTPMSRCSAGFPCHDAQVSSDTLDDAAATIQYVDSIHQR